MQRTRDLAVVGVAALLVTTGCSTYAASRYSISADTVVALRTFRGQTVNVGPFTAAQPGRTEIMCRGVGPIKTPDGEPFEEYIRKALVDELKIADIYAPAAPVVLTGRLEAIDFQSGGDAAWTIKVTLNSSNGRSLSVVEEYGYKSSYYGETACNQTAQALMPAVQNIVQKAVRNPDFGAMLK